MATRFTNESTKQDSAETCRSQVQGPDCPHEHSGKFKRGISSAVSAGNTTRRSRRQKHLLLLATLGFLLSPATGCTMLSGLGNSLKHQEAIDDFMVGYRNQAWAAKAWHCRKQRFCNKRFQSDFEAGFRAGYEAVAEGGNGCVPAVCPQAYWGWQYQTADGQARMNAWFEAYPLGVQAAEEDGIGHWSQVQTSMPMPAPMSPPKGVVPAATAAGSASVALSDQAEAVPTPTADPVASRPIPAAREMIDSEAAENTTAQAVLSSPEIPKIPAPKRTIPKSPVPAVIQPSADPFGFE